jgi:hypothetical protein
MEHDPEARRTRLPFFLSAVKRSVFFYSGKPPRAPRHFISLNVNLQARVEGGEGWLEAHIESSN